MKRRAGAILAAIAVVSGGVILLIAHGRSNLTTQPPVSTPTETPYPVSVWGETTVPIGIAENLQYGNAGPKGASPQAGVSHTDPLLGLPNAGPNFLDASVDEYLNPAPVTAGESPPAGEHFVAVSILLFNHAKPNTSTDVNPVSGVTVLDGTGKKSYSAVTRVNLTGSRALIAAGSHTLGAGEKLSGWVVVAVPNNAGIAAVRFAPKGIYSIQGVWLVCDLAHTQGCALPGNSGPSS